MIVIRDFKYNVVCDLDNHNIAKHSIGMENASAELRVNISTQTLIEIITEGLKRLTDEEKSEILKDYIPETADIEQSIKEYLGNTDEEASIKLLAAAGYETIKTKGADNQNTSSDSLQEHTGKEIKEVGQSIVEEEKEPQKLDNGNEVKKTPQEIRNELLAQAKELGVEGKITTFTNKMLETEIENKIKKLGGK